VREEDLFFSSFSFSFVFFLFLFIFLDISDIKIGGSQGCSDHSLVKFILLRDIGKSRNIVRTINFRKANFQLFKELVSRTPWGMVLRDRGAEWSW